MYLFRVSNQAPRKGGLLRAGHRNASGCQGGVTLGMSEGLGGNDVRGSGRREVRGARRHPKTVRDVGRGTSRRTPQASKVSYITTCASFVLANPPRTPPRLPRTLSFLTMTSMITSVSRNAFKRVIARPSTSALGATPRFYSSTMHDNDPDVGVDVCADHDILIKLLTGS